MKEEFGIDVSVGEFLGESLYDYEHISISLLAYRTFWNNGELKIKAHQSIEWVTISQIGQFDFAPADIPFVEKLAMKGRSSCKFILLKWLLCITNVFTGT